MQHSLVSLPVYRGPLVFPRCHTTPTSAGKKRPPSLDVAVALPHPAVRVWVWFVYDAEEGQPVCLLQCQGVVHACTAAFVPELAHGRGTLCEGWWFAYRSASALAGGAIQCVGVDRVHWYRGKSMLEETWGAQHRVLDTLLQHEWTPTLYWPRRQVLLGRLCTWDTPCADIPYAVAQWSGRRWDERVQQEWMSAQCPHRCSRSSAPTQLAKFVQGERRTWFVKAMSTPDVYALYDSADCVHMHGYALIPSYELSVAMNRVFRYIKENDRLDALEESDTEEEFENQDPGKYVDLTKVVPMWCVFHGRSKKWVPQVDNL